jgi:hypothetical protein
MSTGWVGPSTPLCVDPRPLSPLRPSADPAQAMSEIKHLSSSLSLMQLLSAAKERWQHYLEAHSIETLDKPEPPRPTANQCM